MHVSFGSILLAAIVPIGVSFLWYGPLFGKSWMALMGWNDLPKEAMEKGKKQMPRNTAIQFAATFLMAWVLAHFIVFARGWLGVPSWLAGTVIAFAVWLGYVVPVTIGTVLWEGRPMKYWALLAGNWLASLLLMGLVLGVLL